LVVIVAIIIETSGGVMPIIVAIIVFLTVLFEILFSAMPSSAILWELPRWLEKSIAFVVAVPILYFVMWNIITRAIPCTGECLKEAWILYKEFDKWMKKHVM
jgi:hypothetical protein